MPRIINVFHHSPCFDGLASAILAAELLAQRLGKDVDFNFVGVNYDDAKGWADRVLPADSVVVDYLFNPSASGWYDHHATSFKGKPEIVPISEWPYNRKFDPKAKSCASVIADLMLNTLDRQLPDHLVELNKAALKTDSADYSCACEAVFGNSPELMINQSVVFANDQEYTKQLIDLLRTRRMSDVAAMSFVQEKFKELTCLKSEGLREYTSGSNYTGGVASYAQSDTPNGYYDRFMPYYVYRKAKYSVSSIKTGKSWTVQIGHNPWLGQKTTVHLGNLCAQYGGGGHAAVGGINLQDRDKAIEVANKLRSILEVS